MQPVRRTLRTAASSKSSCSRARMRCSRYTSVLRWMKSCRAVAWRFCSCSRVNEALVSMWFNNSPEAGNWLIDKCAEFGVVPVSFRAHAPNAIIPESSDIGAPALDKLIQNAIAANSAEIDGASGATMTSDGFREAVAQALAKAQ